MIDRELLFSSRDSERTIRGWLTVSITDAKPSEENASDRCPLIIAAKATKRDRTRLAAVSRPQIYYAGGIIFEFSALSKSSIFNCIRRIYVCLSRTCVGFYCNRVQYFEPKLHLKTAPLRTNPEKCDFPDNYR